MIMALRGRFSARDKFLHRARRLNVFSFATSGREFVGHFRRAIEDGDGESFRFHVQDEVFAHYSETDEANITLIRSHFSIFLLDVSKQRGLPTVSEHLERMANPVCEVLLTEARLKAPRDDVDVVTGAVVDFWGIVRGSEEGREIDGIEYEAHREMAEHQLTGIAQQAIEKFALQLIVIQHRIGFITVGQSSLLCE